MGNGILVINTGSTSIKFAAYRFANDPPLAMVCRGAISDMHTSPRFDALGPDKRSLDSHAWAANQSLDHQAALSFIVQWLADNFKDLKVVAAGHRIVFGGTRFDGPILLDDDILDYLDGLGVMEPSHQPANVAGARTLARLLGALPQVACFDNSFHKTMPPVARAYAVPANLRDLGIRHWGFHGLSFEYVGGEVRKRVPEARRVIVAHLGGGSSLCAMLDGASVDTTMGCSGLSGLPMATRSGDLPPEVLFYLLRKGYDASTLENTLYHKSGLLGLSGISGDMRALLDSISPQAALAVDYFVYQVTKFTGAYTAALGGLDALVFTAGIGENSATLRSTICRRLAALGIELDEAANQRHGPQISSSHSKVSVWVIPTNEELVIAEHTLEVAKSHGLLQQQVS